MNLVAKDDIPQSCYFDIEVVNALSIDNTGSASFQKKFTEIQHMDMTSQSSLSKNKLIKPVKSSMPSQRSVSDSQASPLARIIAHMGSPERLKRGMAKLGVSPVKLQSESVEVSPLKNMDEQKIARKPSGYAPDGRFPIVSGKRESNKESILRLLSTSRTEIVQERYTGSGSVRGWVEDQQIQHNNTPVLGLSPEKLRLKQQLERLDSGLGASSKALQNATASPRKSKKTRKHPCACSNLGPMRDSLAQLKLDNDSMADSLSQR